MVVDLKNLLLLAHEIFNRVKAPHALMGAFAMSVHGYPRATNDIDFLVDGDFRDAAEAEFLKNGFNVFHKSHEVLQLSGIGPIDIIFANRDLSRKMLQRQNLPKILGVPCLVVEDIIGLKIQSLANNKKRKLKELADIQAMLEKATRIDWDLVKKYADLFDAWHEIEGIKRDLQNG